MSKFESKDGLIFSLRSRSAFCTTVILLVASQAADAGKSPCPLTAQCRQAAEAMGKFSLYLTWLISAKVTLFSPVSHFETVQAMGRSFSQDGADC